MSVHVHAGVYLSLREHFYPNNSEIPITLIGSTNDALECITDRRHVMSGESNLMGMWISPEGTEIPSQSINGPYFVSRGDDGTINLNRLNRNIAAPFGLFYCVVPDASGINQTLFAKIGEIAIIYYVTKITLPVSLFLFPAVSAEITTPGSPDPTLGQDYNLICSFTGNNMPTAYQWSRIDAGVEVLQNDSELHFSPLQLSHAGNYICKIFGVWDNITMDPITYSNTMNIIIQGENISAIMQSILKLFNLILFSPSSILCCDHK